MKRKISITCLILMVCMLISTDVVLAADVPKEENRPNGAYIRTCVGYEPNYTSRNYTHKFLGSVSGDNRDGLGVMTLTYEFNSSGSTSASIAGYGNASAEAGIVFSKMEAEIGVEVTGTRSWSKGTSAGVSYGVPAGRFELLDVYIPAVTTAGRLKYKVYMDGYPDSVVYEYKTLNASYAPMENSVHYKVVNSSTSALDLVEDTLVYIPTGNYKVGQ